MTSSRITQIVAVIALAACVTFSSMYVPRINQARSKMGFVTDNLKDALPPESMISTALLSVFRGLAVNFLWFRANQMKEAGQFWEANTLAQTITTLQPRFPQVWSFHAWNMAYNISVMTHTPEERWEWVRKGVLLLRERGIPYNPTAVLLYKELGWIFFHKIGQFSDDENFYYKRRMAYEWQEILGNPTEGATKDEAVARMQEIVDAPDTYNALVAEHPEVLPAIDALTKLGYKFDSTKERLRTLQAIGQIAMLTASTDAKFLGIASRPFRNESDRVLFETLAKPEVVSGMPRLLAYLRERTIVEHFMMEPGFMLDQMKEFGPLDWRSPFAHACYWASKGIEKADERTERKKDIDRINTYRGTIHALQSMAHMGRIVFDPVTGSLQMLPDPRFIPAYEKATDIAREDLKKNNPGQTKLGADDSYQGGHENFLLWAMQTCYLYGDEKQAEHYYSKARDLYGNLSHNIQTGRYKKPMQELVMSEITSNFDTPGFAIPFINAMFNRAFTQGLLTGRGDIFEKFMATAKFSYEKWRKLKTADEKLNPEKRLIADTWEQARRDAYLAFMQQNNLDLVSLARAWNYSPLQFQLESYDKLYYRFKERAEASQLDVNVPFPAPPGIEQWRKDNPVAIPNAPNATQPAPIRVEQK